MFEFYLDAETPAKKNSKIFNTKTHRMFPSERYRNWHAYACLVMRNKVKECVNEKCYITLVFCHGDNRRRDSDNGVSSIFDTLVDTNILKDDCWQILRNHCVFNTYEKGKSWCRMRVYKENEIKAYKEDVLSCIDKYM